MISAIWWPLLLLVAVEMFARIGWPPGTRWLLLRCGGLLPVAVIAAVVSYRHLAGLLAYYNEDPLTATLGPLAVDGLMVMATGALIAGRQHPGRPPLSTPATKLTPRSQPARTDTRGTGARGKAGRTGTASQSRRTDDDLKAALLSVRRNADGTVPVRRAAHALGTGPDRARRLLAELGLLHAPVSDSKPPLPTPTTAPAAPKGEAR